MGEQMAKGDRARVHLARLLAHRHHLSRLQRILVGANGARAPEFGQHRTHGRIQVNVPVLGQQAQERGRHEHFGQGCQIETGIQGRGYVGGFGVDVAYRARVHLVPLMTNHHRGRGVHLVQPCVQNRVQRAGRTHRALSSTSA